MSEADDTLHHLQRLVAAHVDGGSVHSYGPRSDQVGELRLPEREGLHPVAVLLHGGFWRARWKRDLMTPLAIHLTKAGWATWNVEYRRVGEGGGVPQTLDDVRTAFDALTHIDAPVDPTRVIALGHSAGGHLALWLATQRRLLLTVSLAGVSCLAEAAQMGIGAGAVRDFCGGMPAELADAYAVADPVAHLPLGVPQLLVHCDRDDIVPVALSQTWTARSRQTGDACELVILPGVEHFALIDPTSAAWHEVASRLPVA